MSNLIDLPPGEDEENYSEGSTQDAKRIAFYAGIGLVVAIAVSFSLAASINISGSESFELGQRTYDVGTCATTPVQIVPKVTMVDGSKILSQFTVTGINPVTCDNRMFRIKPFDTGGSPILIVDTSAAGIPDQPWIDIFISGGEFRASSAGSVSITTDSSLSRTGGSPSIRRSVLTPAGGTSTVEIFSGGQGRTLKSTEDALDGLAISFQVRFSPTVSISGYGRTDLELSNI